MLARNETIIKWALYALTALLGLVLQNAFLQRVTLWGVIPFLYPVLALIPALYEGPLAGSIFALCAGVVCDLILPAPCFYTLLFPLVGLCAALLAQNIPAADLICALLSTVIAFCFTGCANALHLWVSGKSAWGACAFVSFRELCITLPLVLVVILPFRWVCHKVHFYD